MPEVEVTEELMDEVSRLRTMDEESLYTVLGYQSLGLEENPTGIGLQLVDGFSITKSELMLKGKSFFDRNRQYLREKICDDLRYCKKKKTHRDDVGWIMGVAIPSVTAGLNLPAIMAAVLCVLTLKYGLDKLCECET